MPSRSALRQQRHRRDRDPQPGLAGEPRLFYMHFWANDDPAKLAQGLEGGARPDEQSKVTAKMPRHTRRASLGFARSSHGCGETRMLKNAMPIEGRAAIMALILLLSLGVLGDKSGSEPSLRHLRMCTTARLPSTGGVGDLLPLTAAHTFLASRSVVANGRIITLRSSSGPSISLRRNGKALYGVTKPRGSGYRSRSPWKRRVPWRLHEHLAWIGNGERPRQPGARRAPSSAGSAGAPYAAGAPSSRGKSRDSTDGTSSSRLARSTLTRSARRPWAPCSSSSSSSSTSRVR